MMARSAPLKTLLFMCYNTSLFASPARAYSGGNAFPFAVEYLMNSCGLSLDSALSTAPKLWEISRCDTGKPDSVISFLGSCGFKKIHIATVVWKRPIILYTSVDKILRPKIQFLGEIGLPRDLIVDMIVRNPQVMHRSLNLHIKPRCNLLLEYCRDVDTLVATLRRSSQLLVHVDNGRFVRNIECLIDSGIPVDKLAKLIELQPRVLLQSRDWMVSVIKFVRGLGFDPMTPMFSYAVCVMTSMTEASWNMKIEFFKSLGLSEQDVFHMFRRHPYFLVSSKDKLRRALDFLVNTVEIEMKDVINRPHLLSYGIDKRLRPRYNVINALESKNLLRKKKKILTLLSLTEKKFAEDYVMKYKNEVPELMDLYLGLDVVKNGS